jgi:hypothetical protein
MLYGGKVTFVEWENFALKFFSATVAEETERKLFRSRTVNRFSCQRQTHNENIKWKNKNDS